jgi:NAD(P)-dependent dehydrogenase (short-subunit alcohol dehydrogenase family)
LYEARAWQVLELSRSGGGPRHLSVDLGNPDVSFAALEAQFQVLTKTNWDNVVFINNAGVLTPIAPVRALTDSQIEANLAVNLVSAIRLLSLFVRKFEGRLGRMTIANVSSGAALKGYAGWPLYCAAKAGMENFMRSLAAEQSNSAQAMTCINIEPGVLDTDMQAEVRAALPENFPEIARFIALKNAGQLRSPQAVARVIAGIIDNAPENGGRYRIADYD